ncbi:uncharacterized protein DC041_0011481 [Schistosoma bovis]|uniref:Secreted protein n=1 Tax=Schistosoma bovis TaxID=6184 RepID=A0A430Q8Z9_SCHBO|nr:uncharacterized protein DC041_0011481 [Schistosoma bovis]
MHLLLFLIFLFLKVCKERGILRRIDSGCNVTTSLVISRIMKNRQFFLLEINFIILYFFDTSFYTYTHKFSHTHTRTLCTWQLINFRLLYEERNQKKVNKEVQLASKFLTSN